MYKARAPELLKRLADHRSALSTYLTDYQASAPDFQHQLPVIESTLLALEDKVGGRSSPHRGAVKEARLLVSRSRSNALPKDQAEHIYSQLTFLAESLDQDRRDREWRL